MCYIITEGADADSFWLSYLSFLKVTKFREMAEEAERKRCGETWAVGVIKRNQIGAETSIELDPNPTCSQDYLSDLG